MVVQQLSRPCQPGIDAQTMYSFLVLFHLVRLRILVGEEGDRRVYVGIHYPYIHNNDGKVSEEGRGVLFILIWTGYDSIKTL